ncbi:MAG: hypothetical protein AAB601_00910 [Patescibacteria group bacterium]
MALTFRDIPDFLRRHFSSEEMATMIRSIAERAEIATAGTLARTLLRLLTKDVDAHGFVTALTEGAGLSDARARAVARELKEKVLEPVRSALMSWDIDISAINVLNAPALESFYTAEKRGPEPSVPASRSALVPPVPVRAVPVDAAGSARPGPAKTAPPIASTPPGGAQPLIIHEQKAVQGLGGEPIKKFSLPFSFGKTKPPTLPAPPPRAEVEVPRAPGPAIPEKPRVVHFTGGSTPVSPGTRGGETINLDTFELVKRSQVTPPPAGGPPSGRLAPKPPAPRATFTPRPFPPTPRPPVSLERERGEPAPPAIPSQSPRPPEAGSEPQPEAPGPKINGNTIDLRNQQPPKL